jgi:hypothetical protein
MSKDNEFVTASKPNEFFVHIILQMLTTKIIIMIMIIE